MASNETTIQDVRTFLGGLDNIEDHPIAMLIFDAVKEVEADGISKTHPEFDILTRYYAAHLLTVSGLNSQGDVASEAVGDVSHSRFSRSGLKAGETQFLKLYQMKRTKILGFGERIVKSI